MTPVGQGAERRGRGHFSHEVLLAINHAYPLWWSQAIPGDLLLCLQGLFWSGRGLSFVATSTPKAVVVATLKRCDQCSRNCCWNACCDIGCSQCYNVLLLILWFAACHNSLIRQNTKALLFCLVVFSAGSSVSDLCDHAFWFPAVSALFVASAKLSSKTSQICDKATFRMFE